MVRRIPEGAEASRDPIFMFLLDWEKAFDRAKQDKLLEALKRYRFPERYLNAVASFYKAPP